MKVCCTCDCVCGKCWMPVGTWQMEQVSHHVRMMPTVRMVHGQICRGASPVSVQ